MSSKEVYKRLAPSGSRPGILYSLLKLHKINFPLRPILLFTGTHSYNLSKFIVSILNPLLNSPFMISDTFSFLNDLRSLNLDTHSFYGEF